MDARVFRREAGASRLLPGHDEEGASSIVLAAQSARGLHRPPRVGPGICPRLKRRGGRRAKRRVRALCARELLARVAPLGAPSRRLCGAGPRFRRPERPAFGVSGAAPFGQPHRQAFSGPPGPAVSELLAAGHSARGIAVCIAQLRKLVARARAARARALLRARPRAPARSSRAGATGSRPSWGSGEEE